MDKAKKKINSILEKLNKLMDVPDSTKKYKKIDINQNKFIATLSYFGILIIIPIVYYQKSKSGFLRYHIRQGFNLLIITIMYFMLYFILIIFFDSLILDFIISMVGAFITVLSIAGIINSINGKAKEIPFINGFNSTN